MALTSWKNHTSKRTTAHGNPNRKASLTLEVMYCHGRSGNEENSNCSSHSNGLENKDLNADISCLPDSGDGGH